MTAPRRGKVKYYSPKRRAIMAAGDDIDPVMLFERDEWTCHLCLHPIDRHRRCPDPLAATMDHLLPLSLGGQHTWENTAAAHAICNFNKGAKLSLDPVLDDVVDSGC